MAEITKPRCVLCSDGYLQDVLQALDHWKDVDNVKIEKEDDRWVVKFQATDEALLSCLDWWTLKLNWHPLKIGLYYI